MVKESSTPLAKASMTLLKKRGMLFCSSLTSDSNDLELILQYKDSKAGGVVLSGSLAPVVYFTRGKNGKKFGQLLINLDVPKLQADHMKVTFKSREKSRSHPRTQTPTEQLGTAEGLGRI